MQYILLILSYIMLVTARARKENSEETGSEIYAPEQYSQPRSDSQYWNPQYQSGELYDILSQIEEGSDTTEPKLPSKRALSVLSRWRPFGNLGLRMNSVHRVPQRAPMMSMLPELDFVSAETRGTLRPLGQPLRWGRKR